MKGKDEGCLYTVGAVPAQEEPEGTEEFMDWLNRKTKKGEEIGDKGVNQMVKATIAWWLTQGYVKKDFKAPATQIEEKAEDVATTAASSVSTALVKTLDVMGARLAALGATGSNGISSNPRDKKRRATANGVAAPGGATTTATSGGAAGGAPATEASAALAAAGISLSDPRTLFMAGDEDYDGSGNVEPDQENCYAELMAFITEGLAKPGWLGPKLTNMQGPESDASAHVMRGLPAVCLGPGVTAACKVLNESNLVAHFSQTPAEVMIKGKEYVLPIATAWERVQKPGFRLTALLKSWGIDVQGRLKGGFLAYLLACRCATAGRPNEMRIWYVPTGPAQKLKEHKAAQLAAQAAAAAAGGAAGASAAGGAGAAAGAGSGGAPNGS